MAEEMDMDLDEEDKINLSFLYRLKLAGPQKVIEWCLSVGLISSSYECPKCMKQMKLFKRKAVNCGFHWVCKKNGENTHSVQRSITKGSLFEKCNMSLINVVITTYLWLKSVPSTFIQEELELTADAVSDWKSFCREVCVEACVIESVTVGGTNVSVEIDDCGFGHGNWLFYGVENISRRFFYEVVGKGCKEEFLNVIEKCVLPESTILSPCFKTYGCLNDKDFIALKSKHNLTYNGKSGGGQVNSINGIKGQVKQYSFGTRCKDKFETFLAEALWRRMHYNSDNLFLTFIKAISLVYPPPSKD